MKNTKDKGACLCPHIYKKMLDKPNCDKCCKKKSRIEINTT